ncbi:MAG TPA: TatD family hydrolase [Candidatus Dependentiae bacterium]|nr:TatD family hydrolase [Candidatus Dependentiae bacterium]HRQ62341.1 TatD family hydrolase [Candidatus Dependentiae bacterium]
MLIDTHCHLNMMVKKDFDIPINQNLLPDARIIVTDAQQHDVSTIINVGTSLIESKNCILLAQYIPTVFATVGIHPNDCTATWQKDLNEIKKLVQHKEENKIVGIGEIGMDKHYPDYNLQRQFDAFRAQIELALEHDLAIVIHTRDAADETLKILHEYKHDIRRGIIHCFSEDGYFAQETISMGFAIGIGGTVTYPNNQKLRDIVTTVSLTDIVLETDAPFLPPQEIRGKQNAPKYIQVIAKYIAQLRGESYELVAQKTTQRAQQIFKLPTS